ARGLRRAGAKSQVVAASVDLKGLHMASDIDFNRKSFTTGHTGFAMPFSTWPDRADVPRNAARSLRYMDRFVTVTQGEVFYATEMLAQLEGLERGPAGNVSLAAAFVLAQQMDNDPTIVVQETEYSGAGKHPNAQLSFARQMGIQVSSGDPRHSVPGRSIIIPERPGQLSVKDVSLNDLRRSYISNALAEKGGEPLSETEIKFLCEDTRADEEFVREFISR
ncbi:MAG: pyridoxal-phosphate dependent enzyme, partial [bacterium]|nr:pyridoxal-phosphate dependent enzyme [bacterium]